MDLTFVLISSSRVNIEDINNKANTPPSADVESARSYHDCSNSTDVGTWKMASESAAIVENLFNKSNTVPTSRSTMTRIRLHVPSPA